MALLVEILKALLPLLVEMGGDVWRGRKEDAQAKRTHLKAARQAFKDGGLSRVADHLRGGYGVQDEADSARDDSGN